MSGTLLLASAFAGFAYAISPGPAVLALFGITAGQGRSAGAAFLAGHLVGDALWSGMALTAIIGAQSIGTLMFDLLGLVCAGYLFWLGWCAIRVRPRSDGSLDVAVRRPLLRGLIFGVTNPKGYPVAVATFTALLAGFAAELTWTALPGLVAAACVGSLFSAVLLTGLIGTRAVQRLYRRHEIWIVRASGVMFIGFALHAATHALAGLLDRQ